MKDIEEYEGMRACMLPYAWVVGLEKLRALAVGLEKIPALLAGWEGGANSGFWGYPREKT